MHSIVVRLLPSALRRLAKRVIHAGWGAYCPVCRSWLRGFADHPRSGRANAMCPICRSLERHRFAWLVLDHVGQRCLSGRRVTRLLHIAPEPFLETRFRSEQRIDYLSADLRDRRAMEWLDVTRIPHPDRSFDLVFCGHVLEHVTDDREAMVEFHRVLDTGGAALIMVPLHEGATIEAPPGTSRQQRQAMLGHPDHLRLYGPDIADRLEEVGFRVNRTSSDDLVGAAKARLVSVPGQSVFEACKPT